LGFKLDILFQQLYNDYYPKLIAYASFYLTKDEAHDVVQEVFLSLLEKKSSKLEESTLNAYLYRSVHYKCVDSIRYKMVEKKYQTSVGEKFLQLESEYFYSSRNEIEAGMLSQELQEQIDTAIESLPPKGKIVCKLYFLETKTAKEISYMLGLSISTIENHIYTCTKTLRQKLAKYVLSIYLLHIFFSIKM
jgi:RNA polymerase sigma-70 factor (ECF subfamily)